MTSSGITPTPTEQRPHLLAHLLAAVDRCDQGLTGVMSTGQHRGAITVGAATTSKKNKQEGSA